MKKEMKRASKLETAERQEGTQQKPAGVSRRRFLSGAGGAALAVAATGLAADRARAMSSKPSSVEGDGGPAAGKPAMPLKYPHLLSPVKIGSHVLRNRMIATTGTSPHLIVGPEPGPNEAYMHHNANTAKAGAAIVILSQPIMIHPTTEQDVLKLRAQHPNLANPDHGTDAGHFTNWDMANAGVQNLISQLTEAAHFYGSLCMWKANLRPPGGYDVSGGVTQETGVSVMMQETIGAGGQMRAPAPKKELTVEMLQKLIEDVTQQCALGKECGFDGVWLHCGYRGSPGARLLSPLTNRRTDQYGGSHENRARFIIEMAEAIKKRCGRDFFVMVMMSGEEPEGGFTLDDGAEFARLFSECGHIDMLDVKADGGSANAPDNFIPEHTPNLYMTEHYKKKGVTVPLLSDGGFTDLKLAEEAIASGKTDVVGMCRIFICNRDLITLAVEDRNEDVVPCIRCNACHGGNYFSPWTSTCAVNPLWGIEHKIDRMISPPTDRKKVAVIGGGPAGMKAALVAAERGHAVTLYEKTGALGGNFKRIENVSFRWPNKEFKDYLVRQIGKSGVTVRLNTEADAAMIEKGSYDAVLAAVGTEPVVPDIAGITGKNVVFSTDIYGSEDALAEEVVVIGGNERGVEAALHLEEKGHRVTVLSNTKAFAPDAMRVHYYEPLQTFWANHKNCSYVLEARCTGVTEAGVTYVTADGKAQSIKAGSVVVAMGMKAKSDLAITFAGLSPWFYRIGTCERAVDLQTSIRSAFSIASLL